MTTITFTVPPASGFAGFDGTCSACYNQSYQQGALADYNRARAHDGLPPLRRMPRGTIYKSAPAPFFIQRRIGRDVATIDECPTRKDAREAIENYSQMKGEGFLFISRRPSKQWATHTLNQ